MNADRFSGDLENDEWLAWYLLTPQERWRETEKLWQYYLSVGGSLEPEPDPQSPFDFGDPLDPGPAKVGPDIIVTKLGRM
jgi:hypothetical protein